MANYQFSTPNIKIKIKDTRYVYSGGTVHCFLTMERMSEEPYMQLVSFCDCFMERARNTQFKSYAAWIADRCSCSDKYIYIPSDYEYHGCATLHTGDVNDMELARRLAYKKAYRQLIGFYYNCYLNLYNKVMAYSGDIWFAQLGQLAQRWNETNDSIVNAVNP